MSGKSAKVAAGRLTCTGIEHKGVVDEFRTLVSCLVTGIVDLHAVALC